MWPEMNNRMEISDSAAHRVRLSSMGFSIGKASFKTVALIMITVAVMPIFVQLYGRCTFGAWAEFLATNRATSSAGILFLAKSNLTGVVWAGSACGPTDGGKSNSTGAVVSCSLRRQLACQFQLPFSPSLQLTRGQQGKNLLERSPRVRKVELRKKQTTPVFVCRVPALCK